MLHGEIVQTGGTIAPNVSVHTDQLSEEEHEGVSEFAVLGCLCDANQTIQIIACCYIIIFGWLKASAVAYSKANSPMRSSEPNSPT